MVALVNPAELDRSSTSCPTVVVSTIYTSRRGDEKSRRSTTSRQPDRRDFNLEVLDRLTPHGRALVLAFAAGIARQGNQPPQIAIVLLHACLLNTGYRPNTLACAVGVRDHRCVRLWCARFKKFLRVMIESGRLQAIDLLEV